MQKYNMVRYISEFCVRNKDIMPSQSTTILCNIFLYIKDEWQLLNTAWYRSLLMTFLISFKNYYYLDVKINELRKTGNLFRTKIKRGKQWVNIMFKLYSPLLLINSITQEFVLLTCYDQMFIWKYKMVVNIIFQIQDLLTYLIKR